MRIIALLFAGAIALQDSYASRPGCDRRTLRWWKWIKLSVETGVGVTRGLMEYVGLGDRTASELFYLTNFCNRVNNSYQ
ncbi:MAG: hypothetical protein ABI180_09560, partial [Microcoleus sp.]